jgi:hypothetical protein
MTPVIGNRGMKAACPRVGQQLDQDLPGAVCARRDRVGRKHTQRNGIGQALVLQLITDHRLTHAGT